MARLKVDINKLFYSKLNAFRQSRRYCDVTIHVEHKSFECHRILLAAACEYFEMMFCGNFKESSSRDISLRDSVSSTAFEQILNCMYTGEIDVNEENAYDLLRASDFLKLCYIEDLCVHYIKKNVPTRDALDLYTFACTTKKKSLMNALSLHIMKHFENFATQERFLDISYEDLCVILKQNVPVRNENLLVHTIIRWVQHIPDERIFHYDELAKIFRFQDVSPRYMEFILKRYISDCSTSSKRASETETLEIDKSLLDDLKNKVSLHIYVEYLHKRSEDHSITKIFSLNGRTCKWFSKPSCEIYPGAYFLRNIAADNYEYLYCLDYRNLDNRQTFRTYSSMDQYSLSKTLTPPPVVLPRFDICRLRNDVYVYNRCKFDESIALRNSDESFYHYERQLDKWFPIPRLTVKGATMTSDDDRGIVYLIGGPYGSARTYDPRTSHWQMLHETNFHYVDAACCSYDGKIYVSGGERASKRVEVFDVVAGKWTTLDSTIRGRSGHRLLFYENRLYAIGNSFTDYCIEVYDTLFSKWCMFSSLQDTVENGNPDKREWEPSFIQDVVVCM